MCPRLSSEDLGQTAFSPSRPTVSSSPHCCDLYIFMNPVLLSTLSILLLPGCYGTLGLESGGVADAQLSASSVWDWTDPFGNRNVWEPSGARLKNKLFPWAAATSDQRQWLQIDLKREKRITGTLLSSFIINHVFILHK